MIRRTIGFVLIAVGLIMTGGQSMAADAAGGERLARQWCAACHLIDGAVGTSVPQGPPSFRVIAGRLNNGQLRTFLSHPHGAMLNLSLSRAEIEDVIAYIRSLH